VACGAVSTLETTLGQMAPPKRGHRLRMPPDAGGMVRGCSLLGGAICPDVVSRAAYLCGEAARTRSGALRSCRA
jgi:hypothetical protein